MSSQLRALAIGGGSFGLGYFSFQWAEKKGMVPVSFQKSMALFFLKAKRGIVHSMPSSVIKRFNVETDSLDEYIELLTAKPTVPQEKELFTEALRECRPTEQIKFLEDHFLETIPFFFIGDIVYSWTRLYRFVYHKLYGKLHEQVILSSETNFQDFESKVLCRGMWEKTVDCVIPFDVGVCALAILSTCKKNQEMLGTIVPSSVLLQMYTDHLVSFKQSDGKDFLISQEELLSAMATLLGALDAANSRRRQRWQSTFLPFLRKKEKLNEEEFEVVNASQLWCDLIYRPLFEKNLRDIIHQNVDDYVSNTGKRFKCSVK